MLLLYKRRYRVRMVIPIKQHRNGILLTILKHGFAEKAKKNELNKYKDLSHIILIWIMLCHSRSLHMIAGQRRRTACKRNEREED